MTITPWKEIKEIRYENIYPTRNNKMINGNEIENVTYTDLSLYIWLKNSKEPLKFLLRRTTE